MFTAAFFRFVCFYAEVNPVQFCNNVNIILIHGVYLSSLAISETSLCTWSEWNFDWSYAAVLFSL